MSTNDKDNGAAKQQEKFMQSFSKLARTFILQGNRSFKAVPVVISTGLYKGYPAFIPDPQGTESLNFRQLPLEVRVMILKMVLDRGRHFSLRVRKTPFVHTRAVQTSFTESLEHLHMKLTSKDRWRGMPPSSFAILRISKEMLAEAAPIAYGDNTFCFTDTKAFTLFLHGIGEMRVYLKHICLVPVHKVSRALAKELGKLDTLRDLRSLTFRITPALQDKQLIIKILTWLLKPLHGSRLVSGRSSSVLDIIEVQGSNCHYEEGIDLRDEQCKFAESQQAETIVAGIRAEVAKALKIKNRGEMAASTDTAT